MGADDGALVGRSVGRRLGGLVGGEFGLLNEGFVGIGRVLSLKGSGNDVSTSLLAKLAGLSRSVVAGRVGLVGLSLDLVGLFVSLVGLFVGFLVGVVDGGRDLVGLRGGPVVGHKVCFRGGSSLGSRFASLDSATSSGK